MANEQNSIPDEQIDLMVIYKKITSALTSIINLYFNNIKTTMLFLFIATLLAIAAKYGLPKQYTSSFIIRPTDKNEKSYQKVIDDVKYLTDEDDFKALKKELKISEQTAESIVSVSRKDLILNYNKYDTIMATEVILKLKNNMLFDTVQNAIVSYLEENPFFKELREIQKKNVITKINSIEKDLQLLDSLKFLQITSYDSKKLDNSKLLLSDLINPTATFTVSAELLKEKLNLETQLKFINNYQVTKSVINVDKHSFPPRILIMMSILLPLSLLLCGIYLYFKTK